MAKASIATFKLLFPPMVFPHSPYLALPLLKACLEQNGHRAEIEDLNLSFFGRFLSSERLAGIAEKLEQEVAAAGSAPALPPEALHRLTAKMFGSANARSAARHIDEACDVLRDDRRFYIPSDYRWAMDTIEQALSAVSALYYPCEFTREGFRAGCSPFEPEEIRAFAELEEANPFLDFYRSCGVSDTRWTDYSAVGISIAFADQVLAAFTLAREIKARSPETLICCGGNFLTRVKGGLPEAPWLFDWFDALVVGEGEVPIVGLAEALADGAPLDSVEGLVVRRDGRVRPPLSVSSPKGAEWPTPSFDGLPLGEYLSPEPVFPLLTFKGCSYGKCTFCDHHVNYQRLRARPADKVAEDVQVLKQRYGARRFNFVDEEMPPRHAERVGAALRDAGLRDVRWMGYAIYRPEWTPSNWRLLHESGCREMLFGFESASERILEKMKKPLRLDDVRATTAALNEAGIASRINVIVGFPGETEAEAERSRDFFIGSPELFDVPGTLIAFHPFLLVRNAPFAASGEGLAIARSRQQAFALHYAYDVAALPDDGHGPPVDAERAYRLAKAFSREIEGNSRSSGYPLNRLHRFLYICRHDLPPLRRPESIAGPDRAAVEELEPMHTEILATRFQLDARSDLIDEARSGTDTYEFWMNFESRDRRISERLQGAKSLAVQAGENRLYLWHAGRNPAGQVLTIVQEI